jgi:hypothetical protein
MEHIVAWSLCWRGGEKLRSLDILVLTVSSDVSNYEGPPWNNLVGETGRMLFSNRSSFIISGFKYNGHYTYLLYPRPSVQISEEKISEEVSVFRILVMLNNYTLKSSSETLEEFLAGKDFKVSVEATETPEYPRLVWSSREN